jgi:hypothetical protein
MDAISYSIEDSLSALPIGKDAHWSGSPSHLSEISLQHIGGANLFPELSGEGIVVETVVKVLLHASDRPLGFYLPPLLPCFEASYRFAAAGGSKDSFSLGHAGFQMHSFQLDSYIPQFVNDAPLHFEERVDLSGSLQQGRVAIGSDELQSSTLEAPALEVYQEGSPAIDILLVCHSEGEGLPGAILFHPQGAEHNLLSDSYLPYLMGDPVQEKEGIIIGKGLGLVLSELFIKVASGSGYCSSAHLTAEEFSGNAPEPSGAYSLQEEPTDSGIHIGTASFVLVKELEVYGSFCHPGNPQILQEAIACNQVPQVMAASIPLPTETAFVFPGVHLSGDLVFQKTFNQMPEALLERGSNELPDLILDIYLGFLYSFLWSRCWRLHWGVPPFYFFLAERVHPLSIFSNLSYITNSLLLVIIVCGLLVIGCSSTAEKGILEGNVHIGPISPVEQQNQETTLRCDIYDARKIMIYGSSGKKLLKQVDIECNAEENYARYRVELAPGTYTIDINHIGVDSSSDVPKQIKIQSGITVRLDIDIDTGIR